MKSVRSLHFPRERGVDLCYRHPELDCLIAVMVGAAAEGGRYPQEPPLNASLQEAQRQG